MTAMLRVLFLLPLAVHAGWVLATWQYLPGAMGASSSGTSLSVFITEWLAVTFGANAAFLLMYWRLPRGGRTLLSVPKRDWWLATPKRKEQLIRILQTIVEITLFCMNLFFLAVYQYIYQGNVRMPLLALPDSVLLAAFMALPILFNLIYIALAVRDLLRMPGQPESP